MTSRWGKQSKYGDFEIVGAERNAPRLLGQGGFGKTYEGLRRDLIGEQSIEERVAVKVLNPELLTSEAKREQFLKELFVLTEFRHPNLIHYVSCGEQNGEVYYAMELCRGGDLLGFVRRSGALSERAGALIALQIAAGLKEVHQRHNLVHRDIKPSNIMLAEDLSSGPSGDYVELRLEQEKSLCRLVDFGLVDFTLKVERSASRFVGTPMYASPEQIRGARADGRSDIYSLGMTLWFLVQAKGPLLDEDGRELRSTDAAILRHLSPEEHELPLHLSKAFKSVLARMVAKDPSRRIANAAELQKAIGEYLRTPENPDEVKFPSTRIAGPLETLFEIGDGLYCRSGHGAYAARERSNGRDIKLCLAAETAQDGPLATAARARELCKLAELSFDPMLPPGLARVRAVIWAEDFLAYAEEMPPGIGLAELLKARNTANRSVAFAEAVGFFYSIAQGLDFLLARGRKVVSLSCEEVNLTGPTAACLECDPEALLLPLTDWNGLGVSFSLMPPLTRYAPEASGSEHFSTVTASVQEEASDLHPLSSFARLIYRTLAGTEPSVMAKFTPDAFVPVISLSAESNRLIRDLLCQRRRWRNATEFLRDLCAAETVSMRGPSPAAIARVVFSGRVKTPYAPSDSTQLVPRELWAPGREFLCSSSGRRVALPAELPPWEEPCVDHDPTAAVRPREKAGADESRAEFGESLQKTVIASRGRDWPVEQPPLRAPRFGPDVASSICVARSRWFRKVVCLAWAQFRLPFRLSQFRQTLASVKRGALVAIPIVAVLAMGLAIIVHMRQMRLSDTPPLPAPSLIAPAPDAESAPTMQLVSSGSVSSKVQPFQPGKKWENSLGMRFVPLSGTENSMSVWLTRVRDFEAFTEASGYEVQGGMLSYSASGWSDQGASWKTPGFFQSPVHPVVGVSADDAKAFCRWLTQKERDASLIDDTHAYRLPTDDEWSEVGGTTTYPWGPAWPPPSGAGNFASAEAAAQLAAAEVIAGYHDGFATTSPVGSFPRNASGLYDIAGNVCEWCLTPFTSELNSAEVRARNPHENDSAGVTSLVVLRGSSCFDGDPTTLRSDYRRGAPPTLRATYAGFRVVLGPLMQEPPPQIARISGDAGEPNGKKLGELEWDYMIAQVSGDAGKPNDKANQPKAAALATVTPVDREIVGVWTTKGPNGKIEKLEVKADGSYTYSGPNAGSGTASTDGGQLKQAASAGGDAVFGSYDIKGNTLVVNGPNGAVQWHRSDAGDAAASAARHRSSTSTYAGTKPDAHQTPTNNPGTPPAKVGNFEYGKPVPGKPGYVTSPYAPYSGYVDMRNFPPGTEVKDPYTGKTFLVP